MIYQAEYENEEFIIFHEEENNRAIQEAFNYGDEYGLLFNVHLLDDNYDIIETVF